ncbi:MSF1-domain-containing protein [Karstenula rhodostoma CBS 690.94]|uniref:MSF1-domain-containing protein n=1 Tax=Karstenula rhodostoma CBS 690.94 TaxID=1392251 RepID=A0A9P4PD92_9PLEO|nr:MSF1-domain-containing protein [Karstenula rhodostoma CBS 690.94]
MKIFQQSTEFDYSWEEVSISNWRKYGPWNESCKHVIAVDTLSRTVDPSTGILRTERLITCKQTAPKWVLSLLGGQDTSLVYETSYVDASQRSVTLCSMNLTWSDLLNVRETCIYSPSSSNPAGKTKFQQRAEITALCGGWAKIRNKLEEVTVERFQQNAAKGREGFETVLEMSRRAFQEQKSPILREAKI